jgi:phosphate transport system substrate-binding protein
MKNKFKLLSLIAVLIVVFTAIGCSNTSSSITLGGSTSVEPLAKSLADAFMAENPEARIAVQGGGSSAGVKSSALNTVDIGMASRDLKSNETDEWPELIAIPIAIDGVAIVVHPSNSLTNLSLVEARGIFAEGSNDTWTVINREEGSGTREVFEEKVMDGVEVASSAEFLSSNGAVKQKIASTPNAIGYISLGYVDSSVKAIAVDNVVCNANNCRNGSYPISRYLNYITLGEAEGMARVFIEYCLSDAGQIVVEEEHFISLS